MPKTKRRSDRRYHCRACGKTYIERWFGKGACDFRVEGPDGSDVVDSCAKRPGGVHDFEVTVLTGHEQRA